MQPDLRSSAVRRFFTGLTEYAFHSRLGVADTTLVDYIAELLVRFVRADELYHVRSVRGQQLMQVADMLVEAQHREGPARRQVHRHIGDFTLFWTGVYPEVVEHMRRGNKDAFIDYQKQGKRAYWIASTIPAEKESEPAGVLKQLSEQFDLCVYGLGEVRRQWEQRGGSEDAPLLLG